MTECSAGDEIAGEVQAHIRFWLAREHGVLEEPCAGGIELELEPLPAVADGIEKDFHVVFRNKDIAF
jgi:hypothetical protein